MPVLRPLVVAQRVLGAARALTMADATSGSATDRPAVASCCNASGKGLQSAIARRKSSFLVEANTADGVRCQQGGEIFSVKVNGPSVLHARVQDNEDGTYLVEYKPQASGPYSVSVLLHGVPLPGSPWRLDVAMPRPDAAQCICRGDALTAATARETSSFEVSFIDSHGQPTHAEDLDLYVEHVDGGGSAGGASGGDMVADGAPSSLESLEGTGAEKAARAWAREWAILRAATLRGVSAEAIKKQLSKERRSSLPPTPPLPPLAEAQVLEEADEAAAEEAAREAAAMAEAELTDATLDPPAYRMAGERVVGGNKPLIVRLGADLSSEQTGSIVPGGRLLVVESRKTADGSLRALVLLCGSDGPASASPRAHRQPATPLPRSPRRRSAAKPAVPPPLWVEQGEWPEETPRDGELFERESAMSTPLALSEAASYRSPGPVSYSQLMPPVSPWTAQNTLDTLARLGQLGTPAATDGVHGPGAIQQRLPSAFRRNVRKTGGKEGGEEPPSNPPARSAASTTGSLEELVGELTDDVLSLTHGWVTAARDGHELLSRVHEGIEAGKRQVHLTLWERRKAADKLLAKQQASSSGEGGRNDHTAHLSTQAKAELKAGPSFAFELINDPAGIGFAFGGVDPGTLHAHGQIVKFHTVRYSVGLAGQYWLHVGLRQQETRLPGSPFLLNVNPGMAHARSSELPAASIPLSGTVTGSGGVSCSMVVGLRDRMGNSCTSGGAKVQVSTVHESKEHSRDRDAKDLASIVKSSCVDLEDGRYQLEWQSEMAGSFVVSVMIANVHLVGSPFELTLRAAPPEVDKIVVSGEGLSSAQAGRPALINLYCLDKFDNLASQSGETTIAFGLKLLPRDSKEDKNTVTSMSFETNFRGEQYELLYAAQEAGEFGLHLWTDADVSGQRRFLPGSPFAVRVSGVRASAAGSFLLGMDEYFQGPAFPETLASLGDDVKASLTAGSERLQLYPRLRDEFGNASFATDDALVAYYETDESGRVDVPIKQLKELGSYEITQDLTKKDLHVVHVLLDGEHIGGSPCKVLVCPAQPVASKSRLIAPEDCPIVHSTCEIVLESFDKYGNRVDRGGATIAARVIGTGVSAVTTTDVKDGTYTLSFSCAVAGECRVVVRLDNHEMPTMTVTFVKPPDEGTAATGKGDVELREKQKEFESSGDYSMASVYAKQQGDRMLTQDELIIPRLVVRLCH